MRKTLLYVLMFLFSITFSTITFAGSNVGDGNHIRTASGGVLEILPNTHYSISFGNELQSIQFSKTTDLSIKTLESGIWKDVNANSSSYVPLQGYIISNYSQTSTYVTYSYKANINGGSALLQKRLLPGWNLVGVSKNDGEVGYDLYSLDEVFGNNLDYRYVVDFSESAFGTGSQAIRFDTNYHVKSKGQAAYLSEGKAYAIFIESSGLYAGFQNPTDNLGNIEYTFKNSDFLLSSTGGLDQYTSTGMESVTLSEGKITSLYNVNLSDFSINYTLNGLTNTGVNTIFDAIQGEIDGEVFTGSLHSTGAIQIPFNKTVGKNSQVKITASIKNDSPDFNFILDPLAPSNFTKKYSWNNRAVTMYSGSIIPNRIYLGDFETKINVTRVDNFDNQIVAVGSKAVTVNGLNLAVTQGNDVSISNAEYTVTASGDYLNNAFATLFVDGTAVSTKTINASTVKFDNLSKTVSKAAVNLTVKVDFSDAYEAGDFSMKLTNLDIVDVLTSKTVALTAVPTSAVFTVAQAKGTLSSSDANPKASLLLAGDKDQKVLAFRVKAENDSVKLRDVVFSGTNLDNLSNFRLLTPTNKYVASTSNTAANVEFMNLTLDDIILKDNIDTYYLVADVNTNVNATFSVVLDKSLTTVKASNGSIIPVEGENIFGNTHLVAENKAVVAKSSNASKDLNTSALRFSVTASGKNQVTLSGASFDNVLSGYTGSAKLTVYKDTISTANKVGEVSDTTGVVSFTANKTVDAGSTNNYIVVVEGVIIDSNANTPSWTVRLSDLEVVSGSAVISTKAYNNMGEFPLTETK